MAYLLFLINRIRRISLRRHSLLLFYLQYLQCCSKTKPEAFVIDRNLFPFRDNVEVNSDFGCTFCARTAATSVAVAAD